MPDYKQSDISGTTWQRCYQVVLDNPLGGVPTVRFDEQEVLSIDGREMRRPRGTLSLPYDPTRVIALRNPETGELTGESTTYAQAYELIYSAYITAGMARDAAAAPPAEPTEA